MIFKKKKKKKKVICMRNQAILDIDHIVPIIRDIQPKMLPAVLAEILSLSVHPEIPTGEQR